MNPEEKIEELILAGAVEVAGVDPATGEFLYSFTDKIYDVDPDMARNSEEMFNQSIYVLWELGFLNLNVTQQNPVVSLTEKAFDTDSSDRLPRELQSVLSHIIHALRL